MANPLDFLIKDPDAMRYQLMRAAEGMKAGGKAVGGVTTNPPPAEIRTPPGGHMKGVSWEAYRHAIGMREGSDVRGYAGGGKVYGSAVPDAVPPVEQMREALAERSWLDTLAGAGETGLGFLTGAIAQPAAGVAGAVGETLGFGKGEDIAGAVQRGLTYEPTTAAGQMMSQDLMDLMVKSGVASLPPIVSGINPAALRVNPGVARYAGAQAVEAARPLHEAYMAGEVPGAVNPAASVVKNKGGNWLPGSVERNLEPLKRTTDTEIAALQGFDPPDQHISSWVDTKLAKYIKNEMGTPEDPIRALAEKDILHYTPDAPMSSERSRAEMNRSDFNSPLEGVGKNDLAKLWETQSDMIIRGNTVEDWKASANPEVLASMPWIDKLDQNTPIYQRTNPGMSRALGFDHLVDELRNATGGDKTLPQQLRIDPAKLERMSVPEVVNRVADINKWRFEQAGKVALEAVGKLPEAIPSIDPKFTWRNLNNPEDAALSKGAHEAVGKDMGICIGGADYIGRAAKGEADHFSLFDDKGHPHIAIEARPSDLNKAIGGMPDEQRKSLIAQAKQQVGIDPNSTEPMSNKDFDAMTTAMDQIYLDTYGPPPPIIVQVKGKANAKEVNPKYQQQLKEFLNSRPFGDVRETGGLIDTSLPTALSTKMSEMRLPIDIDKVDTVVANIQKKLPRFITEEDLKAALVPEGYARGGAVKPRPVVSAVEEPYNLDEMRHALVRRKG